MFRFLRPQRTLMSISRLPLKLEAQHQKGKISNVQKVHFKKPRAKARTVALYIFAAYIAASAYSSIVLNPLDKVADDVLSSATPEELEEDLKPFFIPFPGTTKQLKPVPYKGSDPEWQEFIKFSKDPKQAQRVRDELAAFVQQLAATHPILSLRYGNAVKIRRTWLDVDFPHTAPPEFERSGIEIGDNHVEWATQPVDSLTVSRIRHALWPSALIQSLWSLTKVMVSDDIKRVSGMLGFRSGPPPLTMDQILAQHQKMMKARQAPQFPNKDKISTNDGPMNPTPMSTEPTKELPDGSEAKKRRIEMGMSEKEGKSVDIKIDLRAIQAHFFRPILAFKTKFAQSWKPAPGHPPRGSILISGMVELDTPKAWMVFDVVAAWDPKERAFDARSMKLNLRRLQLKKQGPAST